MSDQVRFFFKAKDVEVDVEGPSDEIAKLITAAVEKLGDVLVRLPPRRRSVSNIRRGRWHRNSGGSSREGGRACLNGSDTTPSCGTNSGRKT